MSDGARAAILVVDDHTLFRESISRLLSPEPDFGVVAHCASVAEALAVLDRTHVDLVLLDFDLGTQDGLDFLAAARDRTRAKILVVTAGVDAHQDRKSTRLNSS